VTLRDVLPKDRPSGDKDTRDQRPVFAVDPVAGVVDAEPFAVWRRSTWLDQALARGFRVCESGPLVRSSYHAEEQAERLPSGDR
jgi:lipoate synthase